MKTLISLAVAFAGCPPAMAACDPLSATAAKIAIPPSPVSRVTTSFKNVVSVAGVPAPIATICHISGGNLPLDIGYLSNNKVVVTLALNIGDCVTVGYSGGIAVQNRSTENGSVSIIKYCINLGKNF